MDHLPLPLEPLLDPIEVPYRCKHLYDGSSMLDYPERNSWRILYSPAGISYLVDDEIPSDDEIESFIQNYLYFGLLHEGFRDIINIKDFITKNSDGESIITTAALEDTLEKWVAQIKEQQDPEKNDESDWWVHTQKLLHHTWKVALNTKSRHKTAVDERIWLSIAVLAEAIQQVLFDLFRDPEQLPSGGGPWRSSFNPSIGRFICDEMLEKGWCIFDVRRVDLTTKSAATLYFLGNLQPTRPGKDHSKCTPDLCTWMSINDAYKPRHATPGCQCESHFSGIEDIREVLEGAEEIPLIQEIPNTDKVKPAEFKIAPSASALGQISGDFVAISHVWAEGFGNPHANELPACSLKWISSLIDAFPKKYADNTIPFWIDTLCVPISPRHLWLRAMNRLRKPYQEAAAVLVLDSYLCTQDSTSLSPLEIWARVICCSWSRRLWTFQEGRLSKHLLYQFADRALTLEEIFSELSDRHTDSAVKTELLVAYRSSNVIRNLAQSLPEADSERLQSFRAKPDVRDMRLSLQARSLITDVPIEERMSTFWRNVSDIPLGLIFSTARQKLTRPGLRWAPASFMGDIDTRHWYLEQALKPRVDGTLSTKGLEIQVPGFLFDEGLLKDDESFDIIFTDAWPAFFDQGTRTWYFVETTPGFWNQDRTGDPRAGEQLAILTYINMEDASAEEGADDNDPFRFEPGVIAVLGVVTEPPGEDGAPKIEIYRHALLHKYSRALQRYNTMVQVGVERFVMETLGYTMQLQRDEQGRVFEAWEQPEEATGDEDLENFEMTNERRDLCEEYCTAFAEKMPPARDIALLVGKTEGSTPEESFEHFGKKSRFMLQMRKRNRVTKLGQTQIWVVD